MRKGAVTVRGATLRAFRKLRNYSQAELANRAGVSESLVALIETGRRQPSQENAEALAAALDIEFDALAVLNERDPGEAVSA